MTTYRVRKTGSDSNGGTSNAVRSSGSDGIVNTTAGTTLVSSLTGGWTAADIGHAINVNTRTRLITNVLPASTFTVTTSSGSPTVTSAALFTSAMIGSVITGPGIPANTVLQAFTDASHMTMSANAGAGFGTGAANLGALITTTTQGSEAVFVAGTAISWVVGGAWLTALQGIATANQPVHAGDSVYFGAGVYRETVAIGAKSGSAGSPINVLSDYDGAVTGDAGEVTLTSYLVDDKHASTNSAVLALGNGSYWNFDHLSIMGSGVAPLSNTQGSHDWTFTDCTIIVPASTMWSTSSPSTGTPLNITFDRCNLICMVAGAFIVTLPTAAGTADFDANVLIRNCWAFCGNGVFMTVSASGAQPSHGGGVRIVGSTIYASQVIGTNNALVSSVIPCEIHYSVIWASGTGVSAIRLGQIVEDNNLFYANTARNNVAIGPGSVSNFSYAPLLDFGQAYKNTGVARPYLSPSSPASPLLAFGASNTGGSPMAFLDQRGPGLMPPGSPGWRPPGLLLPSAQEQISAFALPTVDWANRPRPAGTRSNLPTVGYLEYHDSGVQDTVTYDVAPTSLKLVGPSDVDLIVPVDASSCTFSIRCLYDTAYQGSVYPTLSVLANAEIGVTAQTVAAVGGSAGTWQTITLAAFTPTATGWVKVRIASRDAGGLSQVNFDTFAVA